MVATPVQTPHRMRRVNELISTRLVAAGWVDPIAFFCECSDPHCDRVVLLAPAAYEHARRDPAWVAVAPRHGVALAHDGRGWAA